jgi:hypothetical protein
MISLRKIFTTIILAAMGFVSCQKDSTLHYSNITMGNIVDGVFISDQGNIFNIKEQTCEGVIDTMKRAYISCDVLSKTAEKTYDIRLNGFHNVFTKSPVDSTAVTDSAVFAEDPLMVYEMWYAGGYINMYIALYFKEGSGQSHLINLVRNDEGAVPGIYEFTLRHNAFGELPGEGDTDFTLGGTYVSFPAADLIKEDEADIMIRWNSGKKNEDGSDAGNILIYKWKRGGYVQVKP